MRRTYRTLVAAVVLAVLAPASAAVAAPEHDAAERSQTIEVAWLMPGPFNGYATFPQTYLPGGVPSCGEGAVQVDVYKYGTPEVRTLVQQLLAQGVLTSSADDARVATAPRVYWFVELTPCTSSDQGTRPNAVDRGDPPRALPARPSVAAPAYAG